VFQLPCFCQEFLKFSTCLTSIVTVSIVETFLSVHLICFFTLTGDRLWIVLIFATDVVLLPRYPCHRGKRNLNINIYPLLLCTFFRPSRYKAINYVNLMQTSWSEIDLQPKEKINGQEQRRLQILAWSTQNRSKEHLIRKESSTCVNNPCVDLPDLCQMRTGAVQKCQPVITVLSCRNKEYHKDTSIFFDKSTEILYQFRSELGLVNLF
jgi:hypothetical protein